MADPVFEYVTTNPFGLSNSGSYLADPTFVDIDNDGDADGFVGNSTGNTLFFRNTGTASNPAFAAAIINPFGLTATAGWSSPEFVDIDGDGDLDAFVGEVYGNTLFSRNTGTANNPSFVAAITNPFGLIDVGNRANPTFVDIDGDGDLDAFIGDQNGYSNFFKNTGSPENPIFVAPVDNPFGLFSVGWYGVSPTFADIDNDGDLDAFLGSGGNYNSPDGTFFFRNLGTVNNPTFYFDSKNPFGLSNVGQYYINPAFVDIDDDNDLDIFVGDPAGNSEFFQNKGIGSSPYYSWAGDFGLNDLSYRPTPTFVDIDGDGDLDAFVGQGNLYGYDAGGDTLFFENTGTVNNPVFIAAITNPFGLEDVGSFAAPTFIDIDNDGDLDAFLGNETGNILFFRNTGTTVNPVFATPQTNPFGLSDVGVSARPAFVDIDADNDHDIFVNNMFFENIGTASNPVFAVPQANPFGLNGSSFAFIDVDGDDDSDAFGAGFFRNTGSATNPLFSHETSSFDLPEPGYRSYFTSQTFVDIDGDADLEAYVTGIYEYGGVHQWAGFLVNNNAPNVGNLTVPEVYSKNTPLNLTDIVISDSDNANVTVTLILSNSAAGRLSTGTSGIVTSTYNSGTGTWTASGPLANVNALLAGVVFTPATNFTGPFTINVSISDGVAAPLLASKNFSVLLVSTPGNNIFTGSAFDSDTLTYASATGPVTVSLNITMQQNTVNAGLDTISQVENLIGSNFADNLTGNSANNVLEGRGGNDILTGWSGADTLIGGPGNDTYFVENSKDVVTENSNQGTDLVSSRLTYTLPANVENLTLTGTAAIKGTGNGLNNTLTGNGAANELNGQAGNDRLVGGGGNDTLIGWSGADAMIGGPGNDTYFVENTGDSVTENLNQGTDLVSSRLTYTLPANVENLTLTGTAAVNGTGNGLANLITGNSAANQLKGMAGNDILDGGTGNNVLTGGTGNDFFRFSTTGHVDTITDYNPPNDTFQLDNAVFTALTATGTLAAGRFRIGAQALDANDNVLYNKTAGTLWYDADGNGAGAAVQIAVIGSGLNLTNADIVVI